jgi:hypothetical protein
MGSALLRKSSQKKYSCLSVGWNHLSHREKETLQKQASFHHWDQEKKKSHCRASLKSRTMVYDSEGAEEELRSDISSLESTCAIWRGEKAIHFSVIRLRYDILQSTNVAVNNWFSSILPSTANRSLVLPPVDR